MTFKPLTTSEKSRGYGAIPSSASSTSEGVTASKIEHIQDMLTRVLRHELLKNRDAQLIIEAGGLFQSKVGEVINQILSYLDTSFQISVNYDLSLDEALKMCQFDYGDSNITDLQFPNDKSGIVNTEIFIINFNERLDSSDVLPAIKNLGLKPANLRQLLALAAAYPQLQKEYPIAGLGSIWKPGHERWFVPHIGLDRGKREVRLKRYSSPWSETRRFAAVRS